MPEMTSPATFFPGYEDQAETYAELLRTVAVERGLIGPREAHAVWERHILNSAALAPLVPEHSTVCDVGSGAGLPGIPLALARPQARITLLEPLLRRSTFLSEAVARLGLTHVNVVRGRAEEFLRSDSSAVFDIVTARAVAPLDRLVGFCAGLVRQGGALLAIKGSRVESELEKFTVPEGWTAPKVLHLSVPRANGHLTVVRLSRLGPQLGKGRTM